jgi:hypothetical protein
MDLIDLLTETILGTRYIFGDEKSAVNCFLTTYNVEDTQRKYVVQEATNRADSYSDWEM